MRTSIAARRQLLYGLVSGGAITSAIFVADHVQWRADAASINALATTVLVGVTAMYVGLTYRLVRVQEHPVVALRAATQEEAARRLQTLIGRLRDAIDALSIELAKQPELVRSSCSDFTDRTLMLFDLRPQLPHGLGRDCDRASKRLTVITQVFIGAREPQLLSQLNVEDDGYLLENCIQLAKTTLGDLRDSIDRYFSALPDKTVPRRQDGRSAS